MRTITALTNQKRNPNRINVYLDNEFAFGLAAITAVSLKVGQTLSAAQIETLRAADELENAKQSALRFLGYRPRSRRELIRNLEGKGFETAIIDQAIARLEELGLVDDAAFARYWVEQRETFKPRSRIALQQELQQKGIQRELIDDVLAEMDETAVARQAALKQAARWQTLPEDLFKSKLSGHLQRRGFSYAIIKQIINEVWETTSTNNEQ